MKKIIDSFRLVVLLSTLAILFFNSNVYAEEPIAPMDIPLLLSGNFGELRNNHFHSGLDFKTQGRTGIPIKAVKSGFISRISVSPYGYGRATYIDHPDGTTSVYGHLDKFAPKFESVVRDSQYRKESFTVNLYFAKDVFPVHQGELIAYSGNTGGSGGPHLHFEFRETASEKPIDPLPFFKDKIKDTRAPDIQGIMLFPQKSKGVINGSTSNQSVALAKDKSGKPILNKPITAWGDIGIGIKSYDRMNETSNIYGVNEIILKVDGTEIYHSVMNRFSFDDTRCLNSFIDWISWKDDKSFYMKSFIEPGNYLEIFHSPFNGIISVFEERKYQVEYILKDVYGNTSTLSFNIIGKEDVISESTGDVFFAYNQDNSYKNLGVELDIPRKNLYTDVFIHVDTTYSDSPFAPLYAIRERVPLHSYCPLTLDITNDSYPDKEKYGVVSVWNNKVSWIGGAYENQKIKTEIRELGDFTVMIDTVAPNIKPVNPEKWVANKRFSFKITDDLSGVAQWKGTIDGQFVLFEYDAKTNSLFYNFEPSRMRKGSQKLFLEVIDGIGNRAEFEQTIIL